MQLILNAFRLNVDARAVRCQIRTGVEPAAMKGLRDQFKNDWFLHFRDGNVYGIPLSETATPFGQTEDLDPKSHQALSLLSARFNEIATEIDRRGHQIAVHAIGDGAVRTTIDGYEAAQRANGKRDSRHRIEHIELIDRADVPRLGALGITASVQPPHAPGAMDFAMFPTLDVIGRDRWADAYLCRDLAAAGAPLAFASDWPVTDISVLRGIQAALTRPTYEGAADQRVPLMEILRAYTAGGAWAAHMDHVTGTLRPGMAADIVVLSGDIEAAPAKDVAGMGVALTIAGGQVTHRA